MLKKYLLKTWIYTSIILVVIFIGYLFYFILSKGIGVLSLDFILASPEGMPFGSSGGIFPAIMGSIYFSFVGTCFAVVLGLSTSIYLCFYLKNESIKEIIKMIVHTVAGIPSIVLGLFGYSFFVIFLKFGLSIVSGGLVLGIMIFPYMEVRFEKTFEEINPMVLSAAYALGVNNLYVLLKLVLPIVFKEMISTITLATSLAFGATAPIMLTGAVFYAQAPSSIFSPSMALPLHLYYLVNEGVSDVYAYGTASILLMVLFLLNFIGVAIKLKEGE